MEHTQQTAERSLKSGLNVEKYPLVEISRTFRAPVEQVWKAWSEPDLIKQWWGPENYTCPDARIDFREGGKSILAMQGPDGKVIYSGGVYQEIVPMKRIITTDQFMDQNGKVISANEVGMPGDWPETLIVTLEFQRLSDNETRMNLVHEGIPKDMHDDCVSGWSTSFNKLQKLVERS